MAQRVRIQVRTPFTGKDGSVQQGWYEFEDIGPLWYDEDDAQDFATRIRQALGCSTNANVRVGLREEDG
jgi:hypothetical protein